MSENDGDNHGKVTFNGLDGRTGSYLLPPMSDLELGLALARRPCEAPTVGMEEAARRGVGYDVDDLRLDQAGWGLVMAAGADEAFAARHGTSRREAMQELLELRARSAGGLYRDGLSERPLIYQPGETAADFLDRYGARLADLVEPDLVPYYLLLVGGPEEIPFEVQFALDIQYGVGRICFDGPEEYAAYARAVVAAERGRTRREREVALFSVRNGGDAATAATTEDLVRPLARKLAVQSFGWRVSTLAEGETDRAHLASLLHGERGRPGLLFTAGHGVGGFPLGSTEQQELQGALVCGDWGGPGVRLTRNHYFGAADLDDTAQVDGLVAFFFACYSAGTPRLDSFGRDALGCEIPIAPAPFVSRLAQRMLSHPNGAALAVVGHVDRAWTHSFSGAEVGRQGNAGRAPHPPHIGTFKDLSLRLLDGLRIGAAMESFGQRYAALGVQVAEEWRRCQDGVTGPEHLGSLWRMKNDARNFVVLGDPAVQVAVPEARESGRQGARRATRSA